MRRFDEFGVRHPIVGGVILMVSLIVLGVAIAPPIILLLGWWWSLWRLR